MGACTGCRSRFGVFEAVDIITSLNPTRLAWISAQQSLPAATKNERSQLRMGPRMTPETATRPRNASGNRLAQGLTVAACLFLCGAGFCIAKADDHESINKLIDDLLAAPSSTDFSERCTRLFHATTDNDLRQLTAHANTTIALAAGWERVRRTIPEAWTRGELSSSESLDKLLELIEQRTKIPPPAFWKEAIRTAEYRARDNIYVDASSRSEKADFLKRGFVVPDPPTPNVRWGDTDWLVTAEGREWRLPRLPYTNGAEKLAVTTNEKRVFFLLYSWSFDPHSLYAADRESGDVKWSTSVWEKSASIQMSGGVDRIRAELQLHDNEIVVFGISGPPLSGASISTAAIHYTDLVRPSLTILAVGPSSLRT